MTDTVQELLKIYLKSLGNISLFCPTKLKINPSLEFRIFNNTLPEKTIEIKGTNLVDLFGAGDEKLKQIQAYFPDLKIIPRGTIVKVLGSDEDIARFEEKFDLMVRHQEKYGRLTDGNIENLMEKDGEKVMNESKGDGVLVHGNNGMKITAKTVNQRLMVDKSEANDLVFAIGPAGSGKTYTAVALAVRALKEKAVRRIILTRPAVEAGENLGFLPGDLKEKLDPYLQPLYDGLFDMLPAEKLEDYLEHGVIQIAPLAFMRGRTLDHAFVILDEAQNATESQIKMFLTRMGKDAKFIVTGDVTQVDLPKHQKSGLIKAQKILDGIPGIGFVYLDIRDVIRHKLVKNIITAFEDDENGK